MMTAASWAGTVKKEWAEWRLCWLQKSRRGVEDNTMVVGSCMVEVVEKVVEVEWKKWQNGGRSQKLKRQKVQYKRNLPKMA